MERNPSDNAKTKSVALYARVSSEEQASSGTIENQLQFLRRFCELHEYRVVGEYLDNGISGTIQPNERPEVQRLLEEAENLKPEIILVYRIDRFSRNTLHLLQMIDKLDELGIALKSATEEFNTQTPTGRMILTLLASFATLERETILERMWQGKIRVASQGRIPGGIAPLGYRVKEGHLEIENNGAALIRRIFEMYTTSGLGTPSIANQLNAEGVLPAKWIWGKADRGYRGKPSSGTWKATRIGSIIKNPPYKGTYNYGSLSVPCPPIIEPALWDTAQSRREQNRLLSGRNTKLRIYLLKSKIFCGFCGRRYVGSGSKTKAFGYSYPNRKPPINCRGPRVPALPLEEAVWEEVSGFAANPGTVLEELSLSLSDGVDKENTIRKELSAIERRLQSVDAERQRILTVYRKGVIDDADLDQQLVQLDRDNQMLVGTHETLADKLITLREGETQLITAEGILGSLKEKIIQASEETKAELMRGLVRQVVVHAGPRFEITYAFESNGNIDNVNSER